MPSAASAGTAPIRAVVDLNVFVAALLGSPACGAVVCAIADGRLAPIVSTQLLTDLRDVLARPKFRAAITPAAVEELIELLERRALVLAPRHHVRVCRDSDDDHLFSLAIAGGAAAIISGDADALEALPISGLRVLSPRASLGWLKSR